MDEMGGEVRGRERKREREREREIASKFWSEFSVAVIILINRSVTSRLGLLYDRSTVPARHHCFLKNLN